MTGLEEEEILPTMMIVGSLSNPPFQNRARIVAAGLCTQLLFGEKMGHLHSYVKQYYKREEVDSVKVVTAGKLVRTNKYNIPTNPDTMLRDFSLVKATKEINNCIANNNMMYVLTTRGTQTLYVLDQCW